VWLDQVVDGWETTKDTAGVSASHEGIMTMMIFEVAGDSRDADADAAAMMMTSLQEYNDKAKDGLSDVQRKARVSEPLHHRIYRHRIYRIYRMMMMVIVSL
jgi:hypothetical protein